MTVLTSNNHSKGKAIINAIAFQIAWFLCVMANNEVALITLVVFCLFHQLFIMRQKKEWLLILGFSSVGFVLDSLLQTTNLIQFNHAIELNEQISIIPIWMACLWVVFSTTLVHGLFWLHKRFILTVLVGIVLVPASYYLGVSLSDSSISTPLWLSLLSISVIWVVLLPVGLHCAKRLDLIDEKII